MKLLLILLTILMVSCAPKPAEDETSVSFRFPASVNQSGLRHYRPKSQFGANTLSSLNDIDCYAITIRYENGNGYCEDTANNTVVKASMAFGSFPQGSSIDLIVPQGQGVTFGLIGFSYPLPTACPDFISFPVSQQQQAGRPKLLATRTVDVEGDTMDITMTRDLAGPDIFTCKNFPFQWETQSQAFWDIAVWDQAQWGI